MKRFVLSCAIGISLGHCKPVNHSASSASTVASESALTGKTAAAPASTVRGVQAQGYSLSADGTLTGSSVVTLNLAPATSKQAPVDASYAAAASSGGITLARIDSQGKLWIVGTQQSVSSGAYSFAFDGLNDLFLLDLNGGFIEEDIASVNLAAAISFNGLLLLDDNGQLQAVNDIGALNSQASWQNLLTALNGTDKQNGLALAGGVAALIKKFEPPKVEPAAPRPVEPRPVEPRPAAPRPAETQAAEPAPAPTQKVDASPKDKRLIVFQDTSSLKGDSTRFVVIGKGTQHAVGLDQFYLKQNGKIYLGTAAGKEGDLPRYGLQEVSAADLASGRPKSASLPTSVPPGKVDLKKRDSAPARITGELELSTTLGDINANANRRFDNGLPIPTTMNIYLQDYTWNLKAKKYEPVTP